MIVLAGIPSEPPLRLLAEALDAIGSPYVYWNQRQSAQMSLEYELRDGQVNGVWRCAGRDIELASISGVYLRLIDEAVLPEFAGLPFAAPARQHARQLHEGFAQWLELCPARVLNKPSANGSNGSKPWQALAIRAQGLASPETLLSNQPAAVAAFEAEQGPLIYKSASGQRSVVRELDAACRARLGLLRHCPVQFQRRVPGEDVRVHVVGQTCFATRIRSSATDYRYAAREGQAAELSATELPDELAAACIRLSQALDLPFAGIDLRITEQGEVWCFEVNPCPGYSYYESHTGQPIAMALARYLGGVGD